MSEPAKKEWTVELDMYSDFTYSIRRVRQRSPDAVDFRPFMQVLAHDELGAFAECRVALSRLNFGLRGA